MNRDIIKMPSNACPRQHHEAPSCPSSSPPPPSSLPLPPHHTNPFFFLSGLPLLPPSDVPWNNMAALLFWKQQALMACYSYALSFSTSHCKHNENNPFTSRHHHHNHKLIEPSMNPSSMMEPFSPTCVSSLHEKRATKIEARARGTNPENPVDLSRASCVTSKTTSTFQFLNNNQFNYCNNYPVININNNNNLNKYHSRQQSNSNSNNSNNGGTEQQNNKKHSSGAKKLIGIRFLFPPFADHVTLYDRAKIWVARHEHKYFVDWSSTDLLKADPHLRPLHPITRQQYKIHMNRSEFCRNVKLKYCLQTKAAWAEEFCLKLQRSPAEGGFTGLCQAKIAAADLWRNYSENYRSHQARQPNRHRQTEKKTQVTQQKRLSEGVEEEAKRIKIQRGMEGGMDGGMKGGMDGGMERGSMEMLGSFLGMQHQCRRLQELVSGRKMLEMMAGKKVMPGLNAASLQTNNSHPGTPPMRQQTYSNCTPHKYSIKGILSDLNNNNYNYNNFNNLNNSYNNRNDYKKDGDDDSRKNGEKKDDVVKDKMDGVCEERRSDCDSTTDPPSSLLPQLKKEEDDEDVVVNVDDYDNDGEEEEEEEEEDDIKDGV